LASRSDDIRALPLKTEEKSFCRQISDQSISTKSQESSKPAEEPQPEEKVIDTPSGAEAIDFDL
jgi:hypothetical protein